MSFDTQNYIDLFYQDADEHLQLMTESLLDLEKNPGSKDALAALFRSAHTMKSSSAMVGFMHVSKFTHRMEDLIGMWRDKNIEITSEMVNLLFKAFDVLKDMMSQLQDTGTEAQRNETHRRADNLINTFQSILTGDTVLEDKKKSAARVRLQLDEAARLRVEEMRLCGDRIYEVNLLFVADAQMASARAFLIVTNLNQMGTVLQTAPDLENDQEELGRSFAVLISSRQAAENVQKACLVSEVESVEVVEVTDVEQFEWNKEKTAAAPVETAPVEAGEDKVLTSFDRREDRMKMQTVRVNIEKLDKLLNLAAEMVIQRGRANELAQRLVSLRGKGGVEEELLDVLVQQGMFLTQLQETIMESRMVPIGSVFSRFRRVVRDLAYSRGKEVNLVIEGEETELDKKIIDQVGDPLMHMVRNSLDHGLETPEERRAAGKPAEGMLYLNAEHQGNSIVITIRDDGRGIDAEVLRRKAVEKGVVTAEEAALLTERECLHLIFRPGFSTAAVVTDISGRGVGMDVVRRSVEQLGGSIEIKTDIGKGTSFFLRLPLTLAIIQALLVESGSELFALPIVHVSETIRINKSDIFSVKGQGKVIRLRENVVPLLNLSRVVEAADASDDHERYYVAVLRSGTNFVGLIVDRMVNEQEIVIKPLGNEVAYAPYVAGAAILGDGKVILILDTASLIEKTLGSAAA